MSLKRRKQRGQGLVEYALILGLVALVTIVIIGMAGGSIQRIFGQIAAVMGVNYNSNDGNGNYITIDRAECWDIYYQSTDGHHDIGIWIEGSAGGVPLDQLQATLETGNMSQTTVDPTQQTGLNGTGLTNAPVKFAYNPLFDGTSNDDGSIHTCPQSIVIKSYKPEMIALQHITLKQWIK